MTNAMRKDLNEIGGNLKFVKNSLVNVATKEYPNRALMGNLLHGQVCLIYSDSENPLDTIKVAKKLEEKHEGLALLGGAYENTLITREKIMEIVNLPDLITLQGTLIQTLMEPSMRAAQAFDSPRTSLAQSLTMSLQAPSKNFLRAGTVYSERLAES
eukprot:CAMPEP_0114347038 /NCGR_PEP_ID=MMETSP0101-20121206/13563_1 /TAXON_ID=38822 ORGANISM="Pteridomonas danica, Strain PT" /NCGR_SAMPLE_ID=MMETSP0101 /ASSEMBLY_ACC=CAM_ASM_000211 /LENGTH=156 /DNA_ID=CAMNT_0001484073 /DNA_START=112 /DNA_END=582 /DNA_ORIENTATION=-